MTSSWFAIKAIGWSPRCVHHCLPLNDRANHEALAKLRPFKLHETQAKGWLAPKICCNSSFSLELVERFRGGMKLHEDELRRIWSQLCQGLTLLFETALSTVKVMN